jgi:hypothetical protein
MRPHVEGKSERGSNWVLRYHEERIINGEGKRVHTQKPLASYAEYPYKERGLKWVERDGRRRHGDSEHLEARRRFNNASVLYSAKP